MDNWPADATTKGQGQPGQFFWLWEVKDIDEAVALGEALPQSHAGTERDRNPAETLARMPGPSA